MNLFYWLLILEIACRVSSINITAKHHDIMALKQFQSHTHTRARGHTSTYFVILDINKSHWFSIKINEYTAIPNFCVPPERRRKKLRIEKLHIALSQYNNFWASRCQSTLSFGGLCNKKSTTDESHRIIVKIVIDWAHCLAPKKTIITIKWQLI